VFGAVNIQATASASAPTGAPAATLVTTRNNSLVFGLGNDWNAAGARVVGSGQTLVHQFLSGGNAMGPPHDEPGPAQRHNGRRQRHVADNGSLQPDDLRGTGPAVIRGILKGCPYFR
jgi:hypothetical protein